MAYGVLRFAQRRGASTHHCVSLLSFALIYALRICALRIGALRRSLSFSALRTYALRKEGFSQPSRLWLYIYPLALCVWRFTQRRFLSLRSLSFSALRKEGFLSLRSFILCANRTIKEGFLPGGLSPLALTHIHLRKGGFSPFGLLSFALFTIHLRKGGFQSFSHFSFTHHLRKEGF